MNYIRLAGTTAAGGTATVNGERAIFGKLYAIAVNLSACDATCDATISTQGAGGSVTLLTLTDSQLNAVVYPRHVVHGETGSALTGTSGGDRAMPLLQGTPRVVIAQGGATKAFTVTLFFEE